ncbi:killer cell lectin-like receptor subfamily F member 1 isoform X2 [Podarcis raffonei]|uniref:killer cell lectin-like receptor subfamily F member 1 isoform X2 n=1 Tax=Podarcis raffonei TaxID=65483 RepID=UPI0023295B66|nr:killer cell lectin-like receptor subfamily F member 1 isoform X2 [Podarcis raffonei]
MEGEDGYTALNFQSRRAASGTAAGAQKQDASGLPCWYRITLWASGFVIIILGVAVTVLALQLEADKGKILLNNGGCNASTVKFLASLRHNFCNQNQYNSSDNSPCKVCPVQWHLHRDKCYWASENIKSWNESQHDCSTRDSQLLVIQDKEELDFIKNITKNAKFWIGLSLSLADNKWMWITGSQLDQSLFPEPKYAKGNYCGKIKSELVAEACSIELRWICQKDSLLL